MIQNIRLKQENGSYDWSFTDDDVESVKGNNAIISSLIHNLLLKEGELEQAIYFDKGCLANNYIHATQTSKNKEMIQNILSESIKNLDGVSDAELDITQTDDGIKINNITIIKTDGGVFHIGI